VIDVSGIPRAYTIAFLAGASAPILLVRASAGVEARKPARGVS